MTISDKTIQIEKEIKKLKKDIEILSQQIDVNILKLRARLDRNKPKQKNKTHSLIDGFFFCVGFHICFFILIKIFH